MRNIFLIFVGLFLGSSLMAQEEESFNCATDEIYNELIKENPEILIERQKLREFVDNYIANAPKSDDVYVIPIVFHVVHYYGVENVSNAQLEEAVEYMNKDFRLLRDDTINIVDEFKNIASDCKIEFRLAKLDPWGECTIGITRTVSVTTFGGGESAKYDAPTWPPEKYLNVWVVNSLSNGAAGWSYYPGTAPYGSDGIILLHDYVGSTGTSSANRGSTLTHEAGHYINLGHPWGHTNDPEIGSNCDMDDGIDDTPNTIGHKSCALTAVTCGSLDNTQNFMEYSYCTKMFTQGQAEEMRAILNSSVGDRNNLSTPENLAATGTSDDYVPQVCAPIADFIGNKKIGCEGFTVQYNDLTYGTDYIENRNWTFDGGNPSSSINESPEIIYNTKGLYSAQLYVDNPVESDIKTIEDYIRVYNIEDGYSLPYTESFETEDFPKISGDENNDFYLESFGNKHWESTTNGYSGNGIKIMNKGNDKGVNNRIFLPNLFIEDTEKPVEVSFVAAYGRSSDLYGDRLKIYVSSSCGDTLRIVNVVSGSNLVSTYVSSYINYIPQASHWKTHSFVINSSVLKGNNLRLIIGSESGGGNAIYVDEVSFSYYNSVDENINANFVSVFPNPFNNEVFIENTSNVNSYQISIIDTMGRILFETITDEQTYNASEVFQSAANGLYLIKIQAEGKTQILKVNKN